MRKNNVHEDKRLLEAFDYIDDKFIAETEKYYRDVPTTSTPQGKAKITSRSIRQALLLAACLLLLSAVIPLVSAMIGKLQGTSRPSDGVGSGQSDIPYESNPVETRDPDNDQPKQQQTGDAFDGAPLFRMVNIDGEVALRCEAFTADGEMLDLCICNSTPCTCSKNTRMTIWGDMICVIESSGVDKVTFLAFDISDRDNIKYTRTTVEGLCLGTHEIWSMKGTPYYCARREFTAQRDVVEELIVLDMSDAINGNIVRRDYPSYKNSVNNLDGETEILHIDGETVYFGIEDKDTSGIVKIARALPGEENATVLFNVDNTWHFGMRTDFVLGEDGTIHFFREEMDDLSQYGYSLYQYICHEGGYTEKVLRATNICDYVLSGRYIYYAVNDPANAREFKNYDLLLPVYVNGNRNGAYSYDTYTDMTGGVIYRLPVDGLDYAPMAAWILGEEYYLYGTTEKSKPSSGLNDHLPIFTQGVDGGIALWANKQVGEDIMHVNLLIGDSDKGIVMTELPGSYHWGWWGVSDVGGGANVNWDYRPLTVLTE